MDKTINILETRHLTKTFGALCALEDVNFTLPQGELRAVIGPNGAGKSTFFSLLMGRTPPTGGEILVNGHDVTGMRPDKVSRLGVSLAFQITNIFPNLTVADNLRLAIQSRGKVFRPFRNAASQQEVEEKMQVVLQEIGLTEKTNDLAANLSHGEQKYLEIGIALGTDPKLLLLDEPTAGMSIEETLAICDLIERLSQRLTVMLVEHDMGVVMRIANKITVLHYGTVLAEGTPQEVRSDSEVQRVYLRGL